MGEPRLRGRIGVVTGGGKGLGRALVRALSEEGADVAFSYRESRSAAEEAAGALRSSGRRTFVAKADARIPGQMAGFVEAAAGALGGVDFLVNNVGVFRPFSLEEISEEALDEASLGGLRPWKAYLPYCASKAALVMATECLALLLAPEVRVNAVAPGILDPPGADGALRRRIPAGRFGSHAEAVEVVLFLLARAGYTTGEVVRVDGGRALR